MRSTLAFFFFLFSVSSYAQMSSVQWVKCIGTPDEEGSLGIGASTRGDMKQTSDGGYIIAGATNDPVTKWDGWLVKLDASGATQWQKKFSSSGNDGLSAVGQTSDGGYLVLAFPDQFVSDGDFANTRGASDAWLFKLDSVGNVVWKKNYGGTKTDILTSFEFTSDGNIILAGMTNSNDGDIKNYHSGLDKVDAWILKLDLNGNIIWSKCYGGWWDEYANSVHQTSDGGYIIAAQCDGDDGDVTDTKGSGDYWLIKIDSIGNLIWEKALGSYFQETVNDAVELSNGSYMVSGSSTANGGDVTGHKGQTGYSDIWIVNLDKNGNVQWQKSFGSTQDDVGGSILNTTSGYIISGNSNKADEDVSKNFGDYDMWILKIDDAGNKLWEESFGGSQSDYPYLSLQTSDGGYAVLGNSSSNDGLITGNNGKSDYVILKLSATTSIIEKNKRNDIICYPNPARDKIFLQNGQKAELVDVYDINGRKTLSNYKYTGFIPLNGLPAGAYLIRLYNKSHGLYHQQTIIKE